ncbi:hypothetical protein IB260_00470 [Pseudomonas sp. PDM23]|uniref:hypothetical protein n=1 Tax=Pseudomonas sp. PDM23 TaxID=2769275 RepID=UPI0017835ADA|nr:hypothetical protein [Pseudomonas sp. PDM23]MBD9573768.1 hypothetical protein [Pseudomonas sp. PDM23]
MLNINEEDLKSAIVEKATDAILSHDADLSYMVRKEVESRINKLFAERVEAQIKMAIDEAVKSAFEREYSRVNSFGQPEGLPTTIGKELEKTVSGYWSKPVDVRTGKATDSTYNTVTRAEFLMTQICAEDFSKAMKDSAINITGALKDGLRNQMGHQMDQMLEGLFKVKSLQDQGKVEKPY